MKIGDPRQYGWLEWITAAAFVLCVLDGVMTIIWIVTGGAREANPMMDLLFQIHPAVFMLVKTTLVALGITLLWRLRRHALAVVGIFVAFIAYYFIVVAYHLTAAGYLIASF